MTDIRRTLFKCTCVGVKWQRLCLCRLVTCPRRRFGRREKSPRLISRLLECSSEIGRDPPDFPHRAHLNKRSRSVIILGIVGIRKQGFEGL